MATTGATLIRFRGSPSYVQALTPLVFQDVVATGIPRLDLKLPQSDTKSDAKAEPLNLQAEGAGQSATWLRFSMPEATPPGTYEGTVLIGAERYPSVVEVDARSLIVISPAHLLLQGAPGDELTANLSVINSGNIPCEIPKAQKIGLLDMVGAERAVGIALRGGVQRGEERVAMFAEELAKSHGGRIALNVEEGAGTLAPGEFRHLSVTLRLPDNLKPGRTFGGTWMLLNLSYYVEVQVTEGISA
jgi:hypothetical protein